MVRSRVMACLLWRKARLCACSIIVCCKGALGLACENKDEAVILKAQLVCKSLWQRECCCRLYISDANKKKSGRGGGGYLSRGVCRSRNQCSVNSSLKLAHIEEGFGHVIANLSAISFCFCCTGVFWSIGHKLLAGKTNGRGMLTRRGLRLPAPLPPPSLVLLQSTCTFLC